MRRALAVMALIGAALGPAVARADSTRAGDVAARRDAATARQGVAPGSTNPV